MREKCTQKKLFAKNICEIVIEGDKPLQCPTTLVCNFFASYRYFIAFFSAVLESAWNSAYFWYPGLIIKSFYVLSELFGNFASKATKYWKPFFFTKVSQNLFVHLYSCEPLSFSHKNMGITVLCCGSYSGCFPSAPLASLPRSSGF